MLEDKKPLLTSFFIESENLYDKMSPYAFASLIEPIDIQRNQPYIYIYMVVDR